MFRVIGMIIIVATAAAMGAILGIIGGTAFLETGRTACEAASCADTIVRSFAPGGALLGGLVGLGKALTMRAGAV